MAVIYQSIIVLILIILYPLGLDLFRRSKIDTQPARNIPGIFAECSLTVAMLRTSWEHLGDILKENIFLKVLDRKVVFVLKVYDLIITNADPLANSSNHEVTFPKYSRNIPRMSVSKIFQGYPPEY